MYCTGLKNICQALRAYPDLDCGMVHYVLIQEGPLVQRQCHSPAALVGPLCFHVELFCGTKHKIKSH